MSLHAGILTGCSPRMVYVSLSLTCSMQLNIADIIAKFPETDYDQLPQDIERRRVTYVIVQAADGSQRRVPKDSVRPAQAGYGTTTPMAPPVHQDQNGTWNNEASGEGSSGGAVPPTYAEAVKGDNKVQSRD